MYVRVFAKVTATDITVITNLSLYDQKHYSFIFHPMYMYVRYRSMMLSDTCTMRRSWTLHAVPGLPVVAWGERGNILLAQSFHAAHYDRDSCEKSAWKYRGNIVRWTWILQRFNEEHNPFLVCGKTWLIITFRCVYCTSSGIPCLCLFFRWIYIWSFPRYLLFFHFLFIWSVISRYQYFFTPKDLTLNFTHSFCVNYLQWTWSSAVNLI